MTFSRVAVIGLLLATSTLPAADEPAWRVGLARRKITPQTPVYLAGYRERTKPFDVVVSDLYVKALVLDDSQGTRGVIVTSDLSGFRAAFGDVIRQRIEQETGIPATHILLNSSHTHTGPSLSIDETERWSNMTEEDARGTAAYTRHLMDDVVQTVAEACSQMQPATLAHGIGVARFVMNRREPTPNGVRLGVNPSGLVDRSVPVLRMNSPEENTVAVLFGAACHNTTLTKTDYFISADWAGYAQEFIQAKHPGAAALFMMGCGGSANPHPRGSSEIAMHHGKELGEEVCRVLVTKMRPIHGPLRVAFDYVDLPLESPPPRERLEHLAARPEGRAGSTAGEMLKRLNAGQELPKHYRCPVGVWQIGGDLTLVGLSGEVVADYVPLIQESIGPGNLWLAAYCNDVFGYVPAASTLREGGYEARGMIYGSIGKFAPETPDVLVAKVRDLARQAGRK